MAIARWEPAGGALSLRDAFTNDARMPFSLSENMRYLLCSPQRQGPWADQFVRKKRDESYLAPADEPPTTS